MIQKTSTHHEGDSCRVYRAYLLNNQGRFISVTELFCRDDEEAIDQARRLASHHAVELWDRGRKVAEIPAS